MSLTSRKLRKCILSNNQQHYAFIFSFCPWYRARQELSSVRSWKIPEFQKSDHLVLKAKWPPWCWGFELHRAGILTLRGWVVNGEASQSEAVWRCHICQFWAIKGTLFSTWGRSKNNLTQLHRSRTLSICSWLVLAFVPKFPEHKT